MFGKFLALFLLVAVVNAAVPRCPSEGIVKLENPEEAAGYYLCSGGIGLAFNCENGKIFDRSSQMCELFSRQDALLPRINPLCPSTGWTQIPHDTSCSKFFNCNEGVATVMSCPAGLHYNVAEMHCDYPAVAKCTIEDSTQAPTLATNMPTFPTDVSTSTNSPTSQTDVSTLTNLPTDVSTSTNSPTLQTDVSTLTNLPTDVSTTVSPSLTTLPAIVPPHNLNCALTCVTETAYAPDRLRCERYWRCENGIAISEKCEPGLRFNPLTKSCDYAINVKCN